MVAWGWEEGEREDYANGYRISVKDDEKVLEMEGGDGCKTTCVLDYHKTVHVKVVKIINVMYILPQKKGKNLKYSDRDHLNI